MLYRKITKQIEEFLSSNSDRMLMIDGARQIGKKAHGYGLYYYDNKKNGEVDFLIDDVDNLSNIPFEIKSGKDYTQHSALTKFLDNKDYNIKRAYVFSNEQRVYEDGRIIYIPIYYIMFFRNISNVVDQFID